jgi:cobyrinic acid a,c-diamide synthase
VLFLRQILKYPSAIEWLVDFMNVPRIVIAGVCSGVGKTTISVGLMSALREAGFTVQAFKVGPDYIDPSYHRAATGRPAGNLDAWMVPHDQIVELFRREASSADMAVVEGVMGLYDGLSGVDETGSTAQIAKILRCPVLLVIDAYSMARSAAAVALGYKKFDENVNISGIILNRVGSASHAAWCKQAIEDATGIPVIGSLPRNEEIELPERHLGLIPTPEKEPVEKFFSKTTRFVRSNVDLEAVIKIAKSAPELPEVKHPIYPAKKHPKTVAIGVAFDEAFNFYYSGNLDLLEAYGAQLKYFSPIHDKALPTDVDGLYIGGGFPEMLSKELEANGAMQRTIRRAADSGMPIYAECGGLMYLTDSIVDFEGKSFRMAGVLHAKTVMVKKVLLNYALADVTRDNSLSKAGSHLKGHEFHSSKIIDVPADAEFAYTLRRGEGVDGKHDAWLQQNVLASYMHIHFAQDAKIAQNFIASCRQHRHK